MAILICAPTQAELAALAPQLFAKVRNIPEMQPIHGSLKSGSGLFMITGIGPMNAALALGLCLGKAQYASTPDEKIDVIIYAGLAAAFDLEQNPLCSIWRITEEIWPEYGLHDGISVTSRAFKHPLWQPKNADPVYDRLNLADLDVLPKVSKVAKEWGACSSITVAGVTASFARRNSMWDAWHAPLENMEGFAAAYAAARSGVPLVEIRVVSHKAGPRGRNEKDEDGALATLGDILPNLNLLAEAA